LQRTELHGDGTGREGDVCGACVSACACVGAWVRAWVGACVRAHVLVTTYFFFLARVFQQNLRCQTLQQRGAWWLASTSSRPLDPCRNGALRGCTDRALSRPPSVGSGCQTAMSRGQGHTCISCFDPTQICPALGTTDDGGLMTRSPVLWHETRCKDTSWPTSRAWRSQQRLARGPDQQLMLIRELCVFGF
jgi:hypothetical protein